MNEDNKNLGAPSGDDTSALFVKARKKQLAEQEAAQKAAEEDAKRLAAEAEVRRLEEQVAERKRQAEEEAKRLETEEQAAVKGSAETVKNTPEKAPKFAIPTPPGKEQKAGDRKPLSAGGADGSGKKPPVDKKILMFGGIGAAVALLLFIIVMSVGGGSKPSGKFTAEQVSKMTYTDYIAYKEKEQIDLVNCVLAELKAAEFILTEDSAKKINEIIGKQDVLDEDMTQPGFLLMDICAYAGLGTDETQSILEVFGYNFSGGGAVASAELSKSAIWNVDGGMTVYYPANVETTIAGESFSMMPEGSTEENFSWMVLLVCQDGRSNMWGPGQLQEKQDLQVIMDEITEGALREMMPGMDVTITAMTAPASEKVKALNSAIMGTGTDSDGEEVSMKVETRLTYWGSFYMAISIARPNMGGDIVDVAALAASVLDAIE